MKKTVLTHFYNEEYLLPFWIDHHKKIFDHGILVNHRSTDRSVEIAKSMAPDWEIMDSRTVDFDAPSCDTEMYELEGKLPKGEWRVTLNTTEFLFGELGVLKDIDYDAQYLMASYCMVDLHPENQPNHGKLLVEQKPYGVPPEKANDPHHPAHAVAFRRFRSIHNCQVPYQVGRHFLHGTPELPLWTLWYNNSPWNEPMKQRKLQIKTQIPEHNKSLGWGFQHLYPIEKMEEDYNAMKEHAEDLSEHFSKYMHYLTK